MFVFKAGGSRDRAMCANAIEGSLFSRSKRARRKKYKAKWARRPGLGWLDCPVTSNQIRSKSSQVEDGGVTSSPSLGKRKESCRSCRLPVDHQFGGRYLYLRRDSGGARFPSPGTPKAPWAGIASRHQAPRLLVLGRQSGQAMIALDSIRLHPERCSVWFLEAR